MKSSFTFLSSPYILKIVRQTGLITAVLISLLPWIFLPAFAQDRTNITYSQEIDTLGEQRFIDRYENVFMKKMPTRHMFKIGLSQYYQPIQFSLLDDKIFNNASLTVGYEFKFLPAFSIAMSAHVPFYSTVIPAKDAKKV